MVSKFGIFLVVLVCLFVPRPGSAADDYDVQVFHEQVPTERQLIEALKPANPQFRSIRPATEPIKPKAVSMDLIIFDFDSYELTKQSKNILKIVGNAFISPELKDQTILIQGHTDSSGSDSYNKILSEQRAQEVKNFLVKTFEIDPDRLKTVGMGESELLNKAEPMSSENRRVQFVTMSQ
jgi:outer membrane protein OmpA-like peptidoglycan-associated protein